MPRPKKTIKTVRKTIWIPEMIDFHCIAESISRQIPVNKIFNEALEERYATNTLLHRKLDLILFKLTRKVYKKKSGAEIAKEIFEELKVPINEIKATTKRYVAKKKVVDEIDPPDVDIFNLDTIKKPPL